MSSGESRQRLHAKRRVTTETACEEENCDQNFTPRAESRQRNHRQERITTQTLCQTENHDKDFTFEGVQRMLRRVQHKVHRRTIASPSLRPENSTAEKYKRNQTKIDLHTWFPTPRQPRSIDLIRMSMCEKYWGSMKSTAHLDCIRFCKTAAGTN